MKGFRLLLLYALCFALPISTQAQIQAWSGILDPSRAIDWSGAGIPVGIPNRTVVCKTVAPSGNTDMTDTNNINSAIASCAGTNQVVQLEAGTYTLAGGVSFNGVNDVTLRGAGPTQTILKFTGQTSCTEHPDICILGSSGWPGNYPGATTWTAGYAKGTSTITVGSTSGLNAGQIIILDQREDAIGIIASPNGAAESGSVVTITTSLPHGFKVGQRVGIGGPQGSISSGYTGVYTIIAVPTSTTFQYSDPATGLAPSGGGEATVDTGGVYESCVGGPTCSNETGSGSPSVGRTCPDPNIGQGGSIECAPGEISYREQIEIKRITAINGNQITLDPPLELPNWRSSQSPGVWWTGNYAQLDGVEGLTYDMTNDGGQSGNGGISFYNTYECWAKNVRGVNANRNHVWVQQSARTEVVDSYFFGTKGGHSKSYGIEVFDGNSDNLFQNNICQHVVSCLIAAGDTGSVYSYNYMEDSGYNTTDWLIGMELENHDFSHYDLFEGNDADKAVVDDIHGSATAITTFRNRLRGQDTPVRTNNLLAADVNAFARFANFVGNIMGTPGAETSYQTTQIFPSGYTWEIGAQTDRGGTPNDPLTTSSLLRWGNYDVVTAAVRWCGNSSDTGWSTTCSSTSEIPTSSFTYINGNSVPSSTTLPASFYLPSQPAFWQTKWGTPPWPAIGPDVTGGTAPDGAGGYSYAIPAQLCYTNTPIDSAYQQTFTITGASWSSGSVTLTIGSNTLVAANTITVSGANPPGYDGTFSVTSETSTTISYALSGNPGPYASGGTVGYPNIRNYSAANCYPAAYPGSTPPAPASGLTTVIH